MMWGWPYQDQEGSYDGGFVSDLWKETHTQTHTYIFLPSHKTKPGVSLTEIQSKKKTSSFPLFLHIPENLLSINLLKPLI